MRSALFGHHPQAFESSTTCSARAKPYSCAGERLSLRMIASAGRPDRARVVELVHAQLR
jgi:hypothetical protein